MWARIVLTEELSEDERKALGLPLTVEEEKRVEGLSWAQHVFLFEELKRREFEEPVILPHRRIIATLAEPIIVHPAPIFPPVILPKLKKAEKIKLKPEVTVLQELTLTVDKTEGYVGDTFTFSGTFTITGKKLGHTVYLYRDDVNVGSGTTDAHGDYSIPWTADVVGAHNFHTELTY